MKIEELKKAGLKADEMYAIVNGLISGNGLSLLDLAYPKHDGHQDANAVGEMMYLRNTINSLAKACDILTNKLTEAIGD